MECKCSNLDKCNKYLKNLNNINENDNDDIKLKKLKNQVNQKYEDIIYLKILIKEIEDAINA
jgi:hypothetical protein